MSGLERRLERLESIRPEPADERDGEKWRARIRHAAERCNECRKREHLEPIFEITEDGTVYTFDWRLVDDFHQSGAELFYWQEVEWGGPGLVLDEEHETFYTRAGELAVSRERFDLRHLLKR